MDSQRSSQDPLDSLIAPPDFSEPTTPQPSHASIANDTLAAVNRLQSSRVDNGSRSTMTPPPSTQVPPSSRPKTRTPTPPFSHMSTPPPTVQFIKDEQLNRVTAGLVGSITADELDIASRDELKIKVLELQAVLQEAKMSAVHYRLQYEMLSQESAAIIERMAVEARMTQHENEVIYQAGKARATATPAHTLPVQEGTIPVEKGLYQRMMRDIQLIAEDNTVLKKEVEQRDIMIDRQDSEIASLTDRVTLMRERIRESREHLNRYRQDNVSARSDVTPRSIYSTPRHIHPNSQQQPQPFAALLQASEMASQESARSAPGRGLTGRKGHVRNAQSTSSLPSTPQRMQKLQHIGYSTPSGRRAPLKVPSTAPVPRTSAMRTPDIYSQPALPVTMPPAPQSDGTVSASEHEDDDSEAETDIIGHNDEVSESQASRAASQMLRSSQDQQTKRDSFKGGGMLDGIGGERLRQTTLSGAVRKANIDRSDDPPAKRARTGEPVGLGIAGVRN